MNDNRKVIYLKDYKEKKNKIEPRDFIYIPIAYRDACFDIVKRNNPKASQKELQSEYNRCMNLAKKHHYPSKALLSLFCYGYFCPRDLNNEIKPVNITELLDFHTKNEKLVTVTAAQPPGRFGILKLEKNNVIEMREKPPGDDTWINGGYYVLESEIFNYLSQDSDVWENEPLNKLIKENQVSAFKYNGIYQPLDTLNDKRNLEKMWNDGKPYWKVWE